MRERYSNDVFFAASRGPPRAPVVPETAFYAGRPRPPPEPHFVERAAATPLRFALLIFAVGWGGILFQTSFLQQVVFGAPVFEELAKLGLALVVATALRIRTLWITLPLALASGAAFGVMEHYVTYAEEDLRTYVGRVAFHAGATGLSMVFWRAFMDLPDVRARWAATVPSTLFHWANNFAALVLGIGSLFVEAAGTVASIWSATVTATMLVSLLAALVLYPRFEPAARAALERAMPRIGWRKPAPPPALATAEGDAQG